MHFVLGYEPDEVPKTLRARQPRGASADPGRAVARRIRWIAHAMGGGLGAWLVLAASANGAVFCGPYTADGGGGPIAPPVICTETAANGLVASASEPFQTASVPPLDPFIRNG